MTTVSVVVRRMTYETTHTAEVTEDLITPDVLFGRDCRTVSAPIVALCGAVLNGTIVVMKDHVKTRCHGCVRAAGRVAVSA